MLRKLKIVIIEKVIEAQETKKAKFISKSYDIRCNTPLDRNKRVSTVSFTVHISQLVRVVVERTLVSSTWHEVRSRLAAFTKQRDNTKRSQRLRCYRGRHEYSLRRGSRVNGRCSIALRREWSDRHFMNREPRPLSAAGTAVAAGSQLGPARRRRFRPRRKWRDDRTWRRARRKCAAYLSGRLRRRPTPPRTQHEPACLDTDIRKSARDHYLANKLLSLLSKNIRVRSKAVAKRNGSRDGAAHANRFPARQRLMRAGRAGAGGGSGARAQSGRPCRRPPRRTESERDHSSSLSQCRLVNTNRPRSRDKYSTFTRRTRARELIASRRAPHTRANSRIARAAAAAAAAVADVLLWQFFQKPDMHRHRPRRARPQPRGAGSSLQDAHTHTHSISILHNNYDRNQVKIFNWSTSRHSNRYC